MTIRILRFILLLLPILIFTKEIDILSALIEKYKTAGSITYRFTRKVVFKNKSVFYKANVTLTPFKDFKVDFYFPTNEAYIFDGKTVTILSNNKIVKKEKVNVENFNELKSLQLLTCFFVYYLSKSEQYQFVKKKGNVVIFKYEVGKDCREILHFNKALNVPERIIIEFSDSVTRIDFSNMKNINGYIIPTKIRTKIHSKRDFTKTLTEEINISELKLKSDFERR